MSKPFYLREVKLPITSNYKKYHSYTNSISRILERYYGIKLSSYDVKYRRIRETIREQFPDGNFSHQDFEILVINDHLIYDSL